MMRVLIIACLLVVTMLPLTACGKRSDLTLPAAQTEITESHNGSL